MFEGESGVVRSESHRQGRSGGASFADESNGRIDRMADLIPTIQVAFQRSTNGVVDIEVQVADVFLKLAEDEQFFSRLRVQRDNALHMPPGETEDVIGFPDQPSGQHLGPVLRDIHSHLTDRGHRMRAHRLAIQGVDAGRNHLPFRRITQGLAGQRGRHGAAAGIAGTDEQQGLHARKNQTADGVASRSPVNADVD